MSFQDKPHFEIPARELAKWLEEQGIDKWWNVDGDPLLTGMLSVPCPADELASAIRRVDGSLLVLDASENATGHGETIRAAQLGSLSRHLGDELATGTTRPPWAGDRYFVLSWKDKHSDIEWILAEDAESTALARAEAQNQAGTS